MKMNLKLIATGAWVGGVRRELITPADSASEACEIAKEMHGPISAGSMGPQVVYLGLDGSTRGSRVASTAGWMRSERKCRPSREAASHIE